MIAFVFQQKRVTSTDSRPSAAASRDGFNGVHARVVIVVMGDPLIPDPGSLPDMT